MRDKAKRGKALKKWEEIRKEFLREKRLEAGRNREDKRIRTVKRREFI